MEKALSHTGHLHKDVTGAKMGMWLFLFSELLFFGPLFLFYSVYRFSFPKEFLEGSKKLSLGFGLVNTLILLTSSLTVALSIAALERGKKGNPSYF
ncbi:MAG: hypothetical protein ABDH49_08330 [Candidatus Hydrothermales bacterium]